MNKKWYLLLVLALLAALALVACGGGTTETAVEPTAAPVEEPAATEAAPAEEVAAPTEAPTEAVEPTAEPVAEATEAPAVVEPAGTLRIWADDTRAPILQDLADEVLAAYNLELVVELKSAIRDDFQVAAPLGEGPDIIVIAHDQAGTLVDNGLLATVDLGDKVADFAPKALEACTFDGMLYCVPYATENMAFFYNTDLVETAPATWEEVVSVGQALVAEGKTTYVMAVTGTTYDAYPLYTSLGGYIFGKDDAGNWNPEDLGIDSEGMITGVQWLADGVANGELPADWDWANNHALFETGEAPFIMAGPWALGRFREAGVPYAIANFPDGGYPFAGTQGFFISAQSENVLLAQAFLSEFIASTETQLALYEVGQRPPAYLPALAEVDDPDLIAMAAAGENATMMPAIPAMGSVWGNWNDGVVLARDGKQDAETAMTEAATKIRDLIANPLTGMVNVPGSYQAQAGCPGDWQPECAVTAMTMGDDGLYASGPFSLKAGDYEVKVALDGSWTTNYGVDGAPDGDNYKFTLTADGDVSFSYDPATNLLEIVLP
ncbi:MAG: extracellular solute-binding protein [Chloroflexi bacterium]|nr:extracellular solute-binding protein [Chloroflexota bacterium]MBP7591412.1 extracellular solute-binding protein [Chloroflexota bacterium]